jgi:hypothetical protein
LTHTTLLRTLPRKQKRDHLDLPRFCLTPVPRLFRGMQKDWGKQFFVYSGDDRPDH